MENEVAERMVRDVDFAIDHLVSFAIRNPAKAIGRFFRRCFYFWCFEKVNGTHALNYPSNHSKAQ